MLMLRITSESRHHPRATHRREIRIPFGAGRFLAAFEGVEGGFAIGSSIVVGLSLAGLHHGVLLSTAVISLIVNGFNAASVKYSTEHYLDELDGRETRNPFRRYFLPSFIEFVCYIVISILTILPLLLLIDLTAIAVILSVTITLMLLFLAGLWRGFILRTNPLRDASETALLGLGIIAVGFVAGIIVATF